MIDAFPERAPAPVPPPVPLAVPPTPTLIRQAGIVDVPAVARITDEGPSPVGVDPEVLARTTRLMLTHAAFENGSLWVEEEDGQITRAVAVLTGTDLASWQSVERVVGAEPSLVAQRSALDVELLRAFVATRAERRPTWIVLELSRTPDAHLRPDLLAAAVGWARERTTGPDGPVAVLADSAAEREAARQLGFEFPAGPPVRARLGIDSHHGATAS